MTIEEQIKSALKRLTTSEKTIVFNATVNSVSGDVCELDFKGLTLSDVRLKSSTSQSDYYELKTPKKGSKVTVISSNGKYDSLQIIAIDEVEKVEIKYQDKIFVLDLSNGKMNLLGDRFGGIPKIKEVDNNLKALKKYCEALKSAVSNGLNAVGVGTSANGGTAKAAFESQMAGQSIDLQDMENKNVTHG